MAARRIGKRENDNLRSFFYRLTPSKRYGDSKGRSGTERLEDSSRVQPACVPAGWNGNCARNNAAAVPLTNCAFWQTCTPAARDGGGSSCGQCVVNRSPVLWSVLMFTTVLLVVAVRWSSGSGENDDVGDDDNSERDDDDDTY